MDFDNNINNLSKTSDFALEWANARKTARINMRNWLNEAINESTSWVFSPEIKRMSWIYKIQDAITDRLWASASVRTSNLWGKFINSVKNYWMTTGLWASAVAWTTMFGTSWLASAGIAWWLYWLYKFYWSTFFKSNLAKTLNDLSKYFKNPTIDNMSKLNSLMKTDKKEIVEALWNVSDNPIEAIELTKKALNDDFFIKQISKEPEIKFNWKKLSEMWDIPENVKQPLSARDELENSLNNDIIKDDFKKKI
jgi:hypothetical protein